jgi:hypothetical protein
MALVAGDIFGDFYVHPGEVERKTKEEKIHL